MKRWAMVAAVAIAVLVQVAVVNRLPLPWGICPDIVVLVVSASALGATPTVGAITGFTAGLAVDLLPPAEHEIGRCALVLCLAGYVIGSLRDSRAYRTSWPFAVAAGATFGVALATTVIGLVVGDPRVSLGSAAVAIPMSVVLTMVVSPLVLPPVVKLRRSLSEDEFSALSGRPWVSGGLRG